MQRKTMDLLENLLESEMAALDTYDQALQEVDEMKHVRLLCQLRRDHEFAAYALRVLLARFADIGESNGRGSWPAPCHNGDSRLHEGARILGTGTALVALRLGEESGVHSYLRVLRADGLAPEAKFLIERQILPRCRDHIGTLDAMLDL